MRGSHDDAPASLPEESLSNRKPVWKIAAKCLGGWLSGSVIAGCYLSFFLRFAHASAQQPASAGTIWATAIAGVFFAVVASLVGSSFYRRQALGIGAAIAATIAAFSMWSWYATPNAAHWLQAIAVLLMAPAAQFAALARRED